MPRIAAALAVLLTAVTCIGFNTARYPVVWEMAAVSGGFTQSRPSDSSAAAPQSTAASQPATVTEPQVTIPSEAASRWSRDPAESRAWPSARVEPISTYPADPEEQSSPGWSEGAPIAAEHVKDGFGPRSTPVDRVAMREPPNSAGVVFDPVAPQAGANWPSRTDWATTPTKPGGSPLGPPNAVAEPAADASNEPAKDPAAYASREPVEATASAKYASSPLDTAARPAGDSAPSVEDSAKQTGVKPADKPDVEGTLVPVKPPTTSQGGSATLGVESSGDALAAVNARGGGGASTVKRLPPVDEVCTLPGADNRPPRPDDPIPIYPTTGIE